MEIVGNETEHFKMGSNFWQNGEKKVHSKRLKSFKLDKFLVKSFVRNGRNLYSIVVNYLVYNFNYSCDEKLFNPVESMQVVGW